MKSRWLVALAATLLLGCQPPGQRPPPPEAAPTEAPAAAAQTYAIDPAASELRILVYRAGALARLGHNHVILSEDLSGQVLLRDPVEEAGFTLSVPVKTLLVDPDNARMEEGEDFNTEPSAADIEGTRSNMLSERVLNGEQFPLVTVQGLGLSGTLPDVVLRCRITILGQPVDVAVPATLSISAQRISVSGELTLSHSQLGLKPFSVMLGALQVAEEMTLRFRVQAERNGVDPT